MVRCIYCERKGAKLRVMLPLRVLARLPRVHVHVRCASAFPCLCVCACACVHSHPGVSAAVFVSLFACGFVAMRGQCIVGLPGSVVSALAYGAASLCCFCVPSAPCLLSGSASFVSSPSLFLGGSLCLFFPVSLEVTSYFFASFPLTNFPRFFGGNFPFPPHHKSFLQNNNTLT